MKNWLWGIGVFPLRCLFGHDWLKVSEYTHKHGTVERDLDCQRCGKKVTNVTQPGKKTYQKKRRTYWNFQ